MTGLDTQVSLPDRGRKLSALIDRAGWGLIAGVAVGLLLSLTLLNQAQDRVAQDFAKRNALVHANALAQEAGALLEADQTQLQARLLSLVEQSPDVQAARVVAGRELVASSLASDLEIGDVPRRLTRAEKPLFDAPRALARAVDENASTGVKVEREIAFRAPDLGVFSVAVPVEDNTGRVVGMVELMHPEPVLGSGFMVTALAVMLAAIVWVALGRGENGLLRNWMPFWTGGIWNRFTGQALTFTVLFGIFSFLSVSTLNTSLEASTAALLQSLEALKAWGSDQLAVSPLDIDDYRRPLGIFGDNLEVNWVQAAAHSALGWKGFGASQLFVGLLGIGVLALFVFGVASTIWDTLVEHRVAYAYVAPAMIGMLLLVIYPFSYGIGLSFTDKTQFTLAEPWADNWVWLSNYQTILTDFDLFEGGALNYDSFWWTLFVTVLWTVSNVFLGVAIGLILAMALNTEGLRGKAIYRILLILPWAIPNYITALVWKGMFNYEFGVINAVIEMFGGAPVQWFNSFGAAFFTGLVTNVWLSFPFMMVVALGGLSSIPKDMYEAAALEGATRWQTFRRITMPQLKPVMVPAIILSVVWTFNMFNVIYLVSGGAPLGANEILITKSYKIAFEEYRYGYAAAYSVIIFAILLIYGIFQNRMTKAVEA